jgi:hypothetical protein
MNTLSTPHLNFAHTTFGRGAATRVSLGALPHRLAAAASVLGPMPKASLRALVDLGLTTHEIAAYLGIERSIVAELRALWCGTHLPSACMTLAAPHLA